MHFGCSRADAARRAGYSKKQPADAKVSAYRLFHSDEVQAAIIEESRKVMSGEGPRSIRALVEIRDDKKAEAKDRIKAATELLNRGGLNAVSEHVLTVEHHMTDAEKDRRILALCSELGLPDAAARKMLIAPDAIEGEFTEVAPKTPEEIERAERYARNNEREQQRLRRTMTPDELEKHKQETLAERSARMKAAYAEAQNTPPMSFAGLEDVLDMETDQ